MFVDLSTAAMSNSMMPLSNLAERESATPELMYTAGTPRWCSKRIESVACHSAAVSGISWSAQSTAGKSAAAASAMTQGE